MYRIIFVYKLFIGDIPINSVFWSKKTKNILFFSQLIYNIRSRIYI